MAGLREKYRAIADTLAASGLADGSELFDMTPEEGLRRIRCRLAEIERRQRERDEAAWMSGGYAMLGRDPRRYPRRPALSAAPRMTDREMKDVLYGMAKRGGEGA